MKHMASSHARPDRCRPHADRDTSSGRARASGDLPQLRHPPDLDPLDDEDVPLVVEVGAVRVDELAGDEARAMLVVRGGLFRRAGVESPRCATIAVVLSINVTRPCRSAITTRPFRSWKWQGRRKPSTKSMCLPSSVNRCRRLLRRSAT